MEIAAFAGAEVATVCVPANFADVGDVAEFAAVVVVVAVTLGVVDSGIEVEELLGIAELDTTGAGAGAAAL